MPVLHQLMQAEHALALAAPLFLTQGLQALLPLILIVSAMLTVRIIMKRRNDAYGDMGLKSGKTLSQGHSDLEPTRLHASSLSLLKSYYGARHDFLKWGSQETRETVFQFNLLQHKVIAVSGHSARQTFFAERGLNLPLGAKILNGAIPSIPGISDDLDLDQVALFHKRAAEVQKDHHLSLILPVIIEDCHRGMDEWAASGTIDPFEIPYKLLFKLTVRVMASFDIAEDPALVSSLQYYYEMIDHTTTASTVMLPWLPSPKWCKKLYATLRICSILSRAFNDRLKSGVAKDDTLQMFIDTGDNQTQSIGFIFGMMLAGVRTTGSTACWVLTFLGSNPTWRDKVVEEIESLLLSADSNVDFTPENLAERMSAITLEEWEHKTPIFDAVLRETLRLAEPHTAMRKNIGPDTYIDGKLIPSGAFAVYSFADVHLNPEVYSNPWEFNPGRDWDKLGREFPTSYIGFGTGGTACQGRRMATLEIKVFVAMFLTKFKCLTVGPDGMMPLQNSPAPDWNDFLNHGRAPGSFALKYERRN